MGVCPQERLFEEGNDLKAGSEVGSDAGSDLAGDLECDAHAVPAGSEASTAASHGGHGASATVKRSRDDASLAEAAHLRNNLLPGAGLISSFVLGCKLSVHF